MGYEIGDIVETALYERAILYQVVCFLDRELRFACKKHRGVPQNPACPDDVHLKVVWKKHKAYAPDWSRGSDVVVPYHRLRQPGNGMLALALASQ